MADGRIDLDTDVFVYHLYTSASNASDFTLSSEGSITNEVASGNGYVTAGITVSAVTWATGASAKELRFDFSIPILTASGGTIANIKFLVISTTGNELVGWTRLTTAQFSLTDTNTITYTMPAGGMFELN